MTIAPDRPTTKVDPRTDPDKQWTRCPSCAAFVYLRRLQRRAYVCPECEHHLRFPIGERLAALLDEGSWSPRDADLVPVDVLGFTDTKPYVGRIAAATRRTGHGEAAVWTPGTIEGLPVVVAALDFDYMGGSIGGVTGELIARAARHALATRMPLVIISASGGARMQEGTLSLMQLAKTSQEIGRLREAGVLTVNLNTDPTYGGATASFSVLGDVVIAEPGARVGFAGPSVIKQTIREDLPEGFQTAEFLRDSGMLDLVVPRENLRVTLARLLALHTPADPLTTSRADSGVVSRSEQVGERPAAEVVGLARDTRRPTTLDYCGGVFEDFLEFHGDRLGADDPAIVAGVARLDGQPVVVVGHQKAHETKELVRRNFGMPQPSGYHKARRLMEHADRHGLPVIAFIDTPGAYPGVEAEQRGQGTAIAECILAMSRLKVPTVSVVTGEGGSGGALALGVGNRVLALENAYYSVISPEGCSTILFGSAESSARAAEALRITSRDLLDLGVVDAVVPEPPTGAAADPQGAVEAMRSALVGMLADLAGTSPETLLAERYDRFARFGNPSVVEGAV